MTPTDSMAFVGDPPLWRPEADRVDVSCTFTWDIEEAYRLRDAWAQHYDVVRIGGPAIDGEGHEFEPGMYVRHGVTITHRGCIRSCPWCLVNGPLRLIEIKPGWIEQSNNLLATPREHQAKVYAMLREQRRRVKLAGGLDVRLLDGWVAEQLRSVPIGEVFLAADTKAALKPLREAVRHLSFLSRRQLRCYVLIAYGGETSTEAEERLEAVWDAGCLPFAQLYQPPDLYVGYNHEWKALARKWSRPAAMFAAHNELLPGPPDVLVTPGELAASPLLVRQNPEQRVP